MRSRPSLLLALGVTAASAALLPAGVRAQPPGPDPSGPPVLLGAPYLVREAPGRLTVRLRLDRPVPSRFDGELRATAVVDGRIASLQPVEGRRGDRVHCYAASATAKSDRLGRLVAVSVVLDGPPQTGVTALVEVRAPRAGDSRGAPLRC
jgi:hypothetical protein